MAVLGVADHRILGFPDGGLAEHDEEGLAVVGQLLDDIEPDTILTFGPDGITFHPDHIAVSRWVRRRGSGAAGRAACCTPRPPRASRPLRPLYEELGSYMTHERPAGTPTDQLALHVDLDGWQLDRKLTALATIGVPDRRAGGHDRPGHLCRQRRRGGVHRRGSSRNVHVGLQFGTLRRVRNWIDHLVLAAPSLDVGCRAVEELIGVSPVFGGVHSGAGTHNALLSLGPPTYLEVIARDPMQPDAPPSPLAPEDLGDEPRLVAFAVGCDDIDAAVAALRSAGVTEAGDPYGMARRRPDGAMLSWRVAFGVGGRVGGAMPFLISWDSGGSPAYDAPVGGRLVALRAGDPDPAQARLALEVLGVDVMIEPSPAPRLEATITTPTGRELTLT